MTHFASLATVLVAAAKKTSSSSGIVFFLFLIVVVFALYFFFIRPNQQKARDQRTKQSAVEVGDEILTVGGIVGVVTDMTDDRITIVSGEAANGVAPTHMVLVRQAIARKIEPPAPDEPEDYEDEVATHDHDESDSHDEGAAS